MKIILCALKQLMRCVLRMLQNPTKMLTTYNSEGNLVHKTSVPDPDRTQVILNDPIMDPEPVGWSEEENEEDPDPIVHQGNVSALLSIVI